MSATDNVTVGRTLPKLASVLPANGPFTVSVTWAKGDRVGATDIVDLAPMIFTFKVFSPLRDDQELFRTVSIGDWGASLVWEGHDDLEIGADAVEEMAEAVMTNNEFAMFLKKHSLTFDAAAAQIGISRRLVAYYAKNREIPRTIALACKQLDTELSARASKNLGFNLVIGENYITSEKVILGNETRADLDFGPLLKQGFTEFSNLPIHTHVVKSVASAEEALNFLMSKPAEKKMHGGSAPDNPAPVKVTALIQGSWKPGDS